MQCVLILLRAGMENSAFNRSVACIAHRLSDFKIKTGVFTNLQALGFLRELVSYEPQQVLALLSEST